MNKDLEGREFNIPDDIINHLKTMLSQQTNKNDGTIRAENLIQTGKVNYGQLKKILHDISNLDKETDNVRYNLYGGDLMVMWGWKLLTDERKQIENNKKSQENANNIAGLNGIRKNAHNKTHEKSTNITNMKDLLGLKSNSEKSTISSLKLSEEINRIKSLLK